MRAPCFLSEQRLKPLRFHSLPIASPYVLLSDSISGAGRYGIIDPKGKSGVSIRKNRPPVEHTIYEWADSNAYIGVTRMLYNGYIVTAKWRLLRWVSFYLPLVKDYLWTFLIWAQPMSSFAPKDSKRRLCSKLTSIPKFYSKIYWKIRWARIE